MRDRLIEIFDREFIESQEAVGNHIIGHFRDLADPDRFVWLRGFAGMGERASALSAVYGGPAWKTHRESANATMIDSDNVLLLRPARPNSGFDMRNRPRPTTTKPPEANLEATICSLDRPADEEFLAAFEDEIAPRLRAAKTPVMASFVTEDAGNNFPALPVRTSEHIFVWFTKATGPVGGFPAAIAARLLKAPEVLRLAPTTRSRLRA
jgi:hypothetical protein